MKCLLVFQFFTIRDRFSDICPKLILFPHLFKSHFTKLQLNIRNLQKNMSILLNIDPDTYFDYPFNLHIEIILLIYK